MKRLALIISPLGYRPSQGMESDTINYHAFFRSNYGGAWEDDEIKVLRTASRRELSEWSELCVSKDYSVITFSGHGDYIENGKYGPTTRLWLKDDESINVDELYSRALRQLFIIDACRHIEPTTVFFAKSATLLNSQDTLHYRALCREVYNTAIFAAEEGRIEMYSCSRDQYAYERRDGSGGQFSHALVTRAKSWAENARNNFTKSECLDCKSAFDLVQVPPPQIPEINLGRRRNIFPFAVSPHQI